MGLWGEGLAKSLLLSFQHWDKACSPAHRHLQFQLLAREIINSNVYHIPAGCLLILPSITTLILHRRTARVREVD